MLIQLPPRLSHLQPFVHQSERLKSGWLYVVGCHEFVKIGIASNVAARVSSLQTGCPYKLLLLGAWESGNAIEEEEALHAHLDEYRTTGEWFKLPSGIIAQITMKVHPHVIKAALMRAPSISGPK